MYPIRKMWCAFGSGKRAYTIFNRCSFVRPIVKLNPVRLISTSKKNSDTITAESAVVEPKVMETVVSKRKRNWQSYGFDFLNEVDDLNYMHATFFCSITVTTMGIIFIFVYYPDMMEYDWFLREAYLELNRRESLGLPIIDPNYTDPDSLTLLSDEELGDTEIII